MRGKILNYQDRLPNCFFSLIVLNPNMKMFLNFLMSANLWVISKFSGRSL